MEYEGQLIPSNIILSIDLDTNAKEHREIQKCSDIQTKLQETKYEKTFIEHEIFYEEGAPFIRLKSNLSERPLTLMLDTGAAVTLLADDLVSENIVRQDYVVNLYGLVGRDFSIKTKGLVHGIFDFKGRLLGTALHLIDRKYAGKADGYLGFSFLAPYKTIIDMNDLCIRINVDSVRNEKETESKNEEEIIKLNEELRKMNIKDVTLWSNRILNIEENKSKKESKQKKGKIMKNKLKNEVNFNETEKKELSSNKKQVSDKENKKSKKIITKSKKSTDGWIESNLDKIQLNEDELETCAEYFEAVSYYKREIESKEELKVQSNDIIENRIKNSQRGGTKHIYSPLTRKEIIEQGVDEVDTGQDNVIRTSATIVETQLVKHPDFPEFATYGARFRSFSNKWPEDANQTPEQLSEAGFFYTWKNDRVICFCCGGGLRDWLVDDDPWEQHALWYDKCDYVRLQMGPTFIADVKKKFGVSGDILDVKINSGSEVENIRAEIILEKLNLTNNFKDERDFIGKICHEFPYQFYLEGDMLGCTTVIEHHIELVPNAKVVNERQYKIPQTHRVILKQIINDYERQGIIEKCQSNYNSPVLLVGKKDEFGGMSDHRFVVDYKKLNEVTEVHNFPIPLIDDILNGLSGCKMFPP